MMIEWYTTKEGIYAVRNYNSRSNKQIWCIAEWLYSKRPDIGGWYTAGENYHNLYYDTAAILLKKLANNEFTGDDNHAD